MKNKLINKTKLKNNKNNKNNKYKKKYTNKKQIGGSICKLFNTKTNERNKNSMIKLNSYNAELVRIQNQNFDTIIVDLQRDRYKKNHWIWWVFPRDRPGNSDFTKVSGSKEDLKLFLIKSPMIKWIQILHLIIDIIKNPKLENIDKIGWYRCMTNADHGKMEESIILWTQKHKEITDQFPEFQKALLDIQQLKAYNK